MRLDRVQDSYPTRHKINQRPYKVPSWSPFQGQRAPYLSVGQGGYRGVWVEVVTGKPLPAHLGRTHKPDYEGLCMREEVQEGHTGEAPM